MALFSTKENLFFMAGHFATDLCHGSMPIILAYMYQQGRLDSYSSVALLMMANTILNALIQPIAGNLADSKPRPYLMSIGIACAFLGVMFIGTVQNQILLYSLVCLNGIGSAIFHPAGGKMANTFGVQSLVKVCLFSLLEEILDLLADHSTLQVFIFYSVLMPPWQCAFQVLP